MKIGDREIGPGHPTFIIGEIGPNHQGSYEKAMLLVDAAAQAGADAVKIQLYTPNDLTSEKHTRVLEAGAWAGQTLWQLYDAAKTPKDWVPDLFKAIRERGMVPFASVFAPWAVDFLEALDCPCYKIASLEIGETDLIRYAARTGKPFVMSTGRATTRTIYAALEAALPCDVVLLHCLAAYPAPLDAMHLKTIPVMRQTFGVPIGLSDHSRQPLIAELAVSLGASVVEAHLMLPLVQGELPPMDAEHSLQPVEFGEMVQGIRIAERALGQATIGPREAEKDTDAFVRRWHFASTLYAGTVLRREHLKTLRGPEGLEATKEPPVGVTLEQDVAEDEPVLPERMPQ